MSRSLHFQNASVTLHNTEPRVPGIEDMNHNPGEGQCSPGNINNKPVSWRNVLLALKIVKVI